MFTCPFCQQELRPNRSLKKANMIESWSYYNCLSCPFVVDHDGDSSYRTSVSLRDDEVVRWDYVMGRGNTYYVITIDVMHGYVRLQSPIVHLKESCELPRDVQQLNALLDKLLNLSIL